MVATQCTYFRDDVYRNFQPNVQKSVIYKHLPKRHFHAAETQRKKLFHVDETLQTLAESVRYFKRLLEDTFVQPRPPKRLTRAFPNC